jgi:hypothetical protein
MLRIPAETGWLAIIRQRSALFIALAAVVVAIIIAVRWFIEHRLPPVDWRLAFNADAHGRDVDDEDVRAEQKVSARRLVDAELVEKTVLMSVVTISSWLILPSVRAEALPTAAFVTIVIVTNTVISEWLVRQGMRWRSVVIHFSIVAVVNLVIAAAFLVILPARAGQLYVAVGLLSLLPLTVLITLYDRYRPLYLARKHRPRVAYG